MEGKFRNNKIQFLITMLHSRVLPSTYYMYNYNVTYKEIISTLCRRKLPFVIKMHNVTDEILENCAFENNYKIHAA